MAVEYTLSFSSNTGADIEYELDILRTSYSGTAKQLKGQASPITIQWKRDRDVYSPIMGSKASINLLVEDGDMIADFNDSAPFTYEVRLRWKDTDDNLHDVWKGWIEPNDGEERVGSYPYPVSFVATDGFANLESAIREPEDRGQVSLLHYILYSLEQTGLGLDVRIDSSIVDEDGTDALTNTTVDELAFISADTTQVWPQNADSRLDVLSGILAAFNCSVRQANGIWYVFSNSLHGGTGVNETNTWNVYEYNSVSLNKIDGTNYEEASQVSENLLYTLDSTTSTDLYVKDESLFLTPRYPFGSVEADFQDLRPKQHLTNPRFENGVNGWEKHSLSYDNLVRNVTGGINGASLTTKRNRAISNTLGDIWFETSDEGAKTISKNFSHELKFHWMAERFSGSGRTIRLKYQIYAEFDSNITQTSVFQGLSWNPLTWLFGNPIRTADYTSNRIYYDHRDNGWELDKQNQQYWGWVDIFAEGSGFGSWREETLTIGNIGDRIRALGGGGDTPDSDPKLYIRFFYPELLDSDGDKIDDSTTQIQLYMDNLSVLPIYEGDDADPTFERAQDNYTTTMVYQPNIYGDSILEQQFNEQISITDLWESNQDLNVADPRSLEQIVTNQKLKDWQDQFYYYECTFVNNNEQPIAQHNKIKLDLTNHSSSTTLIQNGGSFDPKMNTWKVGMYIPNQTGGVDFGSFTRYNVDLIGVDPPVRDSRKRIVIAYDYSTVDDDGNAVEVADSEGREPGDTGYESTAAITSTDKWTIAEGFPGQTFNRSLIIHATDDYEIDGLVELLDTNANPAPTYMNNVSIERLGSFVEVSFSVTIPEESEFETAYFKATVDELVGDNTRVVFDANGSGLTNANILQGGGEITEIGPVGSTERFIYNIVASSGFRMTPDALTVTLNSVKDGPNASDTDVSGVINSSDIIKVGQGNNVAVIIPFKYPVTSPVYADITFSGTAATVASEDTVDVEIRLTEAGTETDDWSVSSNGSVPAGATYDAVWTGTGVPGTEFTAIFEISPESGKYVDSTSTTLASLDESWLGDYYVVSSRAASSEALVFLTGTFPDSDATGDDSASITANANIVTPSSTTAVAHSYTWSAGTGYFFNNSSNSYSASLEPGEVSTFTISMEANSGSKLGTVDLNDKSVTYDVDIDSTLPTGVSLLSKTPYATAGVVEYIDFEMQVTGQSTAQTGTITFNGDGGTQPNLYTLRLNLNSTDAFNAQLNKAFIDIYYGDADFGDTDSTDRTFTIQSADSMMTYTSVGDVSITSGDTSIVSNTNITKSITDGVITATIGSLTIPSQDESTTGLFEVDITVGGPATTFEAATTGSLLTSTTLTIDSRSQAVNIPVKTNGQWVTEVSGNSSTRQTNHQGNASANGAIIVTPLTNNTGSSRTFTVQLFGSTDGSISGKTGSQLGSTVTITQLSQTDVRSPDVVAIRVVTQAEYNAISGTGSDNTLYLIEQ